MRIRTAITAALATTGLVTTGLLVGNRVNMLPVGASSNASTYDALFKVLFSIGTVLFLGIAIVLIYSLVKFRRPAGDTTDGLAIEGNLPLEIVWTAIPAVVILFVGIYSYDIYERMGGMAPLVDHSAMHSAAMHDHAEPGPPTERIWGGIGMPAGTTPAADGPSGGAAAIPAALPVDVTAMQFAFLFHYPDGDITSGELHVPLGQPVELRMEARDVIHAFWVPQFRLKQDVIPGQTTLLSFTPTRTGTFPIVCAELCGAYHGGMRTNVIVHEPDAFAAWRQQNAPVTNS